MEEDEVTPIDPINRLSVYDTDFNADQLGWNPELKKRVEDSLLSRQGIDFILAEAPVVPPPWPNYDRLVTGHGRSIEIVARKIVERVEEDGYDVDLVIAYERANANRDEVIVALEKFREKQEIDAAVETISSRRDQGDVVDPGDGRRQLLPGLVLPARHLPGSWSRSASPTFARTLKAGRFFPASRARRPSGCSAATPPAGS